MRRAIPGPLSIAVGAAALAVLQACASPFKTTEADGLKAAMLPSISATPVTSASAVAGAASADPVRSAAPSRWELSEHDRTLKVGLERWAQASGWRLIWELGVDYPIEAPAAFDGSFDQAIAAVMRNLEHADVPPKAILYRGNQVVRVVARGMQ